MRSLKDARGGSGEYDARSEDPVRLRPMFCLSLFFFLFVFSQSDAVHQGVQLEEKGGGKY